MIDFPDIEYEQRFERSRTLMAERGIDALVVSNIENVAYLTGSASLDHSWAMQFMEPIAYASVVIVPRSGRPILIVHDVFDGVLAQSKAIDDRRVYYERGRDEEQPYVELTIQSLKEIGCDKGCVAVELGAGFTTDPKIGMPLKNFFNIKDRLPEVNFVDGSAVLRTLRITKSEREIACIKRATEAADKTFAVCFEEIKKGMTETDVVTVCNRILSEQGVRPVWTLAICNPKMISSPRPDVRLDTGSLLFLDLGATYRGYNTDFNRMAVVGRPSAAQRKACKNISDITRATIEAVKPGMKACDVVEVCRNEYRKRGLETSTSHETRGYGVHRKIGHGIGLSLSEAPQIATYDSTPLEPGMTFCIEPPLTTKEGFYVTEQVVEVTDHFEILSRADNQLYEI